MRPSAKRITSARVGRWGVAVAASLRNTYRQRALTRISPDDGAWLHRCRGVAIPSLNLVPIDPMDVDATTRDIFLWKYTPADGDIVIDIGAGFGSEALLFSRLVGDRGRVVCVEAHPGTFGRLERLVAANGLTNVTTVHGAITEHHGQVLIGDSDNDVANSIIGTEEGIRVPALTLGDLLARCGIDEVDFLKMNIEGAEVAALRAAPEVLSQTAHVCVSCHDFLADSGGPAWTRTKDGVREVLEAAGFAVSSRPDHPLPWGRDYLYGTRTTTG